MGIAINQSDNFYAHQCAEVGQRRYYSACLKTIGASFGDNLNGLSPECANAISHGKCPALGMMSEEMAAGVSVYYRDRDDAGVGIVGREEMGLPARNAEQIAAHHLLLKNLDLEPVIRTGPLHYVPQRKLTTIKGSKGTKVAERSSHVPASQEVLNAFDIGALINQEVAAL